MYTFVVVVFPHCLPEMLIRLYGITNPTGRFVTKYNFNGCPLRGGGGSKIRRQKHGMSTPTLRGNVRLPTRPAVFSTTKHIVYGWDKEFRQSLAMPRPTALEPDGQLQLSTGPTTSIPGEPWSDVAQPF